MHRIMIGEQEYQYESGTTYLTIAREFQKDYQYDIVLVEINGKLQELHKKLDRDGRLEFITTADRVGMQTYQRSVTLLLMKAFYDVVGSGNIKKLMVDFSIGKGCYVRPEGDFQLSEELLSRVKERMHQLVDKDIPIHKKSVNTNDAVELFHKHKMYDKEKLFRFRRVSKVNIYSINEFEDYYYGYMVQSTRYLKYFDLIPYQKGFVLVTPLQANPTEVPEFVPLDKLFHVLQETSDWGELMNISTVGDLDETIAKGSINELILVQEAMQEKKIAEIAEDIAKYRDKKLIMIAGPSSSGKTTFSHRLSVQLLAHGLKPHPIAVDNYFVDRDKSPRDENGNYNFELLECLDVEQFNKDMLGLLNGETVQLPYFNFITGKREYKGDFRKLGPDDILVIEGIHCLNDKLSYALPKGSKYKIYISALTQLNIDEHNRIPTTDGRLIRRMVRDSRTRGTTAQETIRMWNTVRKGEEMNIFPFQEEADMMFNSVLIYELAILKQYAEPLLFDIPQDSAEYTEAKRLLKFFDYFLGVSSEDVPKNSILREFIGGSCFRV